VARWQAVGLAYGGVGRPKKIMLAAANAADRGSMPAELRLALLCERWDSLPEDGGIMNQPVGLLTRMGTLLNVYHVMRGEQNRGDMDLASWSRANPDAYKVFIKIHKMQTEDEK
jgi:hypothetical protein